MLTIEVLEASADTGYVLDGFPRTLRQAEAAYRIAQQFEDVTLQAVIHLEVGRDELRRRLLGRARREGRVDDDEATINHRLEVYDPATDVWSGAPAMPTPRHGLGAATLGNRIYVVGGGPRAGLAQTDVVEIFSP